MEDAKIIKGSSLTIDYQKLGYSFIAYVGVFLQNTSQTKFVLERIYEIPHVTVAHITTGKFNIFLYQTIITTIPNNFLTSL